MLTDTNLANHCCSRRWTKIFTYQLAEMRYGRALTSTVPTLAWLINPARYKTPITQYPCIVPTGCCCSTWLHVRLAWSVSGQLCNVGSQLATVVLTLVNSWCVLLLCTQRVWSLLASLLLLLLLQLLMTFIVQIVVVALRVCLPDCLYVCVTVRVWLCLCVSCIWFCSQIKLIPDEIYGVSMITTFYSVEGNLTSVDSGGAVCSYVHCGP